MPNEIQKKNLGGRPLIKIDWAQVDHYCEIWATEEEIAAKLGISADTLARACKREKRRRFAEYFKEKRVAGLVSLRHRQYMRAQEGSDTMLIWMGKQYLGQKDVHVQELRPEKPVVNITYEVVDGPATGTETGPVPSIEK